MRRFTSSRETLLALYNDWQVLRSEVPKGFEKYFQGGKKTQAKPEAKPEEAPKTETKGLYHLPLPYYCAFLTFSVQWHKILMNFSTAK